MKYFTILSALLIAVTLLLVPVLTPCTEEDETGCNWNAQTSGNGLGTSFVAFTDSFRISY